MKLSRKADYALRAIRFLSRLPSGETASINRIAQGESIPREFVAKILKELTVQNLIVSFQGVRGGYRLAGKPKDVTFLDVIEAVNGPIYLNLCTEFGKSYCYRVDECEIHAFWVKQEAMLKHKLAGKTFAKYARQGQLVQPESKAARRRKVH